MNNFLPIDEDGVRFSKPTYWLNPREYAKIISEINQNYHVLYKDKCINAHKSAGYIYWFENHGFNKYNIFSKVINIY